MKKYKYYFLTALPLFTSCASLNDSLQFGAGMGAISGGVSTYAAYSSTGRSPSLENVAVGAGIGLGLGLFASYLVHKSVEDKREEFRADQTEMHFGDLPPSPFIVPKSSVKKGGAR